MTVALPEIVLHPSKHLRAMSATVEAIDDELHKLLKEMSTVLLASGGIGIAAPQIAVNKRVAIIGIHTEDGLKQLAMINPEIVSRSDEVSILAEGCLSIPGQRYLVERPTEVDVSFIDFKGKERRAIFTGIEAKCVQHEIDHLNGVLILDRGPAHIPGEKI